MTEPINYQSPYYLQVRKMILDRVSKHEYLPGQSIPSEYELAASLGINRLTVRAALADLVDRGIIRKVRGKGSYVVGEELTHDMEKLEGFTQTTRQSNHRPKTKILNQYIRSAGSFYAEILNTSPEEDIYYIRRIDYVDDWPFSLEEIYIPKNRMPKLEDIDLSVYSLTEAYAISGVKPEKASETMDLVQVDGANARLLDMRKNRYALLIRCITYDQSQKVVEYSRSFTQYQNVRYVVNFN